MSGFATVTVTVPTEPAGAVTTSTVPLNEVTVAVLDPNVTVQPARKPVPVSVTALVPAGAPLVGAMALIVGAGL